MVDFIFHNFEYPLKLNKNNKGYTNIIFQHTLSKRVMSSIIQLSEIGHLDNQELNDKNFMSMIAFANGYKNKGGIFIFIFNIYMYWL